MEWIWIRHGMTEGNRERRYIGGQTDEGLCGDGRKALEAYAASGRYPAVGRVYVSPMKRCLETAQILYPGVEMRIVPGFRECDFGLFENKNERELSLLPVYQEWIRAGRDAAFPGGESPDAFRRRSVEALLALVRAEKMPERTAFVVHGGIIMAVFAGLDEAKKDFYDYYTENGEGFACRVNMRTGEPVLHSSRRF